jgi:hypothetical protein
MKIKNLNGIYFHIIGILCLFWFLIRVVPAPYRFKYPCQQISLPIALVYISFWSVLFHGILKWIRKTKYKTSAILPTISMFFVIIFTISGMVFADNYFNYNSSSEPWDPIPKDPIGIPRGVNPGRVVWIWNPDATKSDLNGYWWQKENNDQFVIDEMFSTGIKGLTGLENLDSAWDSLFRYFNSIHGYNDTVYQKGEKIAIKINMNNCWEYYKDSYTAKDNDRDANPYVLKSLLRQLVDVVGVSQDDITVYDASRPIANWFYNRVYYENYPSIQLTPEFPNINYVDNEGGATGRQKVTASSERIYFADGTGLYRTLPNCVVDAKYIINMPLLKRHPLNNGNGVTLSAKNMFGTWIEPVTKVHSYHESGHIINNPAPQTDLLSHKHIGAKTLLYIGDGTFGTVRDHRQIDKFQMYPFNNDWTNSLFFSQDPVALDSVMYDFLYTEGTNPSEGSQNYLHQSADPPSNVYDPENDGVFINDSLGVHEHWDETIDIFLSSRYSGKSNNGIDFITYGNEFVNPGIFISKPIENYLYFSGNEIIPLPFTLIIGDIEVEAQINGISEEIEKVEFYLDNILQETDYEEPFLWNWDNPVFLKHSLYAIAFYNDNEIISNNIVFWKFF